VVAVAQRSEPAQRALEGLALTLAGEPVTVLGAAPLGKDDPLSVEGRLLAVNGGISSVAGDPDVWVVNSRSSQFEQWGPSRRRLARLMLKQGAGKRIPFALFLAREPEAPGYTLDILRSQGTTVERWDMLTQIDRRLLEHQSGVRDDENAKGALSAGVTAAAFALLAGAAEVRLLGFSWAPGYAYLPGERIDARGHVPADMRGLKLLQARYGTRLQHSLPIPERARALAQART
jgi:hypothetical protein